MTEISGYIDLLEEMLAIPAYSRSEHQRADFLENWMTHKGWSVMRFGNNLMVSSRSDNHPAAPEKNSEYKALASKWLLLNSHIDTISPSEEWNGNPCNPVRKDGAITALGSNDAGASAISLMAVFDYFERTRPGNPLLLLLSAEEEVSGAGGLESVLPELDHVGLAIVGEPTGMEPAVAERGLMVIDAVAVGEGGHAARSEGVNAIYRAMADISSLQQLTFNKDSQWLSLPSVHVTMIEAGTQHNVIPDLCKYVIDVRSNDLYSNEILFELIRDNCSSTLVPRSTRLRSSALPDNHFAFQAMKEMKMNPFGSPTLSDMALMPFPAIKMGPGESQRSHTVGEYILLKEIEESVPRYIECIERLIILQS